MFLGQSTNWSGLAPGYLGWVVGTSGTPIPPPPYAVFSMDGSIVLSSISGLDYAQGSGPSADSLPFYLLGAGLLPAADDITITPSGTDFEMYNPNDSTYHSTAFTVPYTSSAISLAGFKVRSKAGLSAGAISGTFTITAPNTLPFVLSCSATIAGPIYMLATGGTETIDGNFKVHTFNSSDIFEVIQEASASIDNEVEYLIVAGGGSGASCINFSGGGGGGGGVLTGTYPVVLGVYTCVIGSGAPQQSTVVDNSSANGTNGSNSSVFGLTAIGGGGGANGLGGSGLSGGSGGGGGAAYTTNLGGSGTIGQGYDGGDSNTTTVQCAGGGGGGGASGGNSTDSTTGNGGNGLLSSITGTATYYGGGGGGGAIFLFSSGGLGGGGNGASSSLPAAIAGNINTGGGGGGGSQNAELTGHYGASGGSGVVIIRYRFQ